MRTRRVVAANRDRQCRQTDLPHWSAVGGLSQRHRLTDPRTAISDGDVVRGDVDVEATPTRAGDSAVE